MSRSLARAHDVDVVAFAGGAKRGACVQINSDDPHRAVGCGSVQLTRVQAEFVRDVLAKWLGDDSGE